MRCVMAAAGVTTLLLHLPGRHIAIAPPLLLAFIPTSRTLVVIIAVVVTVAIAVPIGMLVTVAAMAVSVATFGVGAGRQGYAHYKC